MKRSEINEILKNAKTFLADHKFMLPPWAYWGLTDWQKAQKEHYREIIDNMLGWDITDFGSGDFYKRGLFLFTLRNGKLNVDKKPYAEKIMIVEENQETPMHFHWYKMEDIINRGGGNLVIELYNSTPDEGFADTPVNFKTDGVERVVQPGGSVILSPGESICLEQGVYHRFYGEPGKGRVLVGEVSTVNDDTADNRFYETVGRFPSIVEDEEPLHLLVSDYKSFLG
ncbi:MAG TPA: D-lyxose/D-mannose family sugar isomerase [Bacteroidales bacterium]|jgi:D-lyxose ketol-isomerase|nr:D-lyxose/D-mannose family sugar isomerase [Bacteroidales bacterium]